MFNSFFKDSKSAFDSIDIRAFIYQLSKKEVSNKLLNVIKKLILRYRGSSMGNEGLSQSFETDIGVRQRCLPSPLKFSFFIDDLKE